MIKDLQLSVQNLKDINNEDIRYLLLNSKLSFLDVSTLKMIEKRISKVIDDLENLSK